MLWSPAAFGSGAAIYFGLSKEPSLAPSLLVAVIAIVAAAVAHRRGASKAVATSLALVAFGAAGFARRR